MILTQTPYRVSLFGGGSDYREWFRYEEGAVLGMAIDQYCYVGVKRMPVGQVMEKPQQGPSNVAVSPPELVPIRFRVQYSKVDDCTRVEDIKHPAVKGALRYYGLQEESLEFHCFGDQPGRSGLGGSSSFTVGLCHALSRLNEPEGLKGKVFTDPWRLVHDATTVSLRFVEEAVGLQDQIFAAHGGLNFINFRPESSGHSPYAVHPLALPGVVLDQLCESLVLVFSGTMRDASAMAAAQIAQLPQRKEEVRYLVGLAYDAAKLLQKGHVWPLGEMLNEAWRRKRALASGISNEDIDRLYQFGLRSGAIGGKLLGAGGGGFMLFFVPPSRRESFSHSILLEGLHEQRFGISRHGSRVINLEE